EYENLQFSSGGELPPPAHGHCPVHLRGYLIVRGKRKTIVHFNQRGFSGIEDSKVHHIPGRSGLTRGQGFNSLFNNRTIRWKSTVAAVINEAHIQQSVVGNVRSPLAHESHDLGNPYGCGT